MHWLAKDLTTGNVVEAKRAPLFAAFQGMRGGGLVAIVVIVVAVVAAVAIQS